jgi:hypothetical protein
MAQSGQLRGKVSEAQLIELLEQVSPSGALLRVGVGAWQVADRDRVLDGRSTEQDEHQEDRSFQSNGLCF